MNSDIPLVNFEFTGVNSDISLMNSDIPLVNFEFTVVSSDITLMNWANSCNIRA
jgi:hypothetical protein